MVEEPALKPHLKERAASDSALLSLYGKTLLVDHEIGLGYLGRFVHAIESGSEAFRKVSTHEIISPDLSRVIETGNMNSMKNERLTAIPKGSIIKLFLNDYMSVDGDLCTMGIQELADNLLSYKDNPNVSGAILEVNSGGGEAMAGQIMYNAVLDFKKPVVAFVHNAGSAAFLAIAGVKEIVASGPLSRVGSIGAFVSLDKKFISLYKDRFDDIYSDFSGDKNSAIRSYIETGDKTGITSSLNETVTAFQNIVTQNREVKKKDTLSGGMFIASEAKSRGLVDIIGTESLAIKRLQNYIK